LAGLAGVYLASNFERHFVLETEGLEKVISVRSHQSRNQFSQCVDRMQVDGLGLQKRRPPTVLERQTANGRLQKIYTLQNRARGTRLDMIETGAGLQVEMYAPPGRGLRPGEQRHLQDCLNQA
jgi:hypothetical protein